MEIKYLYELSQCSLFSGIPKESILPLLMQSGAVEKNCAKNTILISSQDIVKNIIIVLSGKLKIVHDSESFGESFVEQINPSECFGLAYCLKDQPCYVTARAVVRSDVLIVNYQRLIRSSLFIVQNTLVNNIMGILADKVTLLAQKINYMYIKSLRAKLCSFLLNHYNRTGEMTFQAGISRTDLADYLGVSRAAMTRELQWMRKEGLIDYDIKTFTLMDIERMMDVTI